MEFDRSMFFEFSALTDACFPRSCSGVIKIARTQMARKWCRDCDYYLEADQIYFFLIPEIETTRTYFPRLSGIPEHIFLRCYDVEKKNQKYASGNCRIMEAL